MVEREWDDPNWSTGDTLTAQQFADHVTEGHFPSDELQFTITTDGNPAFVDPQNGDAEILTYDRSAQTWTLNTLNASTEVTSPSVDATDVTSDTVTATTEVTSPSVTGDTTSATNALELPTYPTLGDVPTTLTEGTLVYVEDANEIYVEDGT